MNAIEDIHGDVVMGNQLTSYKRLSFLPYPDRYFRYYSLFVYLSQVSLPYYSLEFINNLVFKIKTHLNYCLKINYIILL